MSKTMYVSHLVMASGFHYLTRNKHGALVSNGKAVKITITNGLK